MIPEIGEKMERVPFKVHAFVCTNDRHGERKSCADGDAVQIRDELKKNLKRLGLWGSAVRVSTSGCLGNCAIGPNVYIYPQMIRFSGCTIEDVPKILEVIVSHAQD